VTGSIKDRVERLFGGIAVRMAGLPACNSALRVEVVGLQPWQGLQLGVLVTPWTISLILLSGELPVEHLGADQRQSRRFPSGEYEFMGGTDPALGSYQSCSLISPPVEFSSHEEAREVAIAALYALFEAADNGGSARDVPPRPLSRRGFLTGGTLSRTR
jgi:[NiFe] hydrogenase assembly HybE family chaperone